MQIDVGYFYFIKDSFFDIMDDPELMKNKESGNKRPCYYCIKSKKYDNIIWFIPVSTKIEKYKKIYDSKIQKQIKLGKNPSIRYDSFWRYCKYIQCIFNTKYVPGNIRLRRKSIYKKQSSYKSI